MLRSLSYFWKINAAVALGAGVATSVLTGALLVGDSVRGSLRDLTLDRLGETEFALLSDRFFREEIAGAIEDSGVAPAVLTSGAAIHSGNKARASRVQILGIDARFAALYGDDCRLADLLATRLQFHFPAVVINRSLANELKARVGDDVALSFPQVDSAPRESLFGQRSSADVVRSLRLTIAAVIPDAGPGRFGLRPHQSQPLNAFVELNVLQSELGQAGRVNALLVAGGDEVRLQRSFDKALRLADLQLRLREGDRFVSLESERFILSARTLERAASAAREIGVPMLPIFTYLANSIEAAGRSTPYSTVTALEVDAAGSLYLVDGSSPATMEDDDILLNQWLAHDLAVSTGDSVAISYYVVGAREELLTRRAPMRVAGIVAMEGLAADPTLTPDYPGIQEAGDMSAWSAPFPVDLGLIRDTDEKYWDEHGATPKAFVSFETGRRLWGSRFGHATSIRFAGGPGVAAPLERELRRHLRPSELGLTFRPVRQEGLEAAAGATDFSMLFIGFSMFLIVSAALLVGLLFRYGVEQRAVEIGVMLATGLPMALVRRRFLTEGIALAGFGGLIGIGGAVAYAGIMMLGLRTWWLTAVGTPMLFLHVEPLSLVAGYAASVMVVCVSVWLALRRVTGISARALLAGDTTFVDTRPGKRSNYAASAAAAVALVAIGVGVGAAPAAAAGAFFAGGALLLLAGLGFFSRWLKGGRATGAPPTVSAISIGARNSRRHPGRSMLCAALVGCACFVIVAVGANRRVSGSAHEWSDKSSGTGGFALIAESDIPLHQNLNSPQGRFELGVGREDERLLDGARFFALRSLQGEDASCLNLYKPQQPRILGVPAELIQRGGFRFKQSEDTESENPWLLLDQDLGPGVVPAIGDYNSVLWILHLGLGDELLMQDESGGDLRLRLVGLLESSLFQSELLISEANLVSHFPNATGFGFFAVDVEPREAGGVSVALETSLARYGFDVSTAAHKLAGFQAVENTYLSTFQTLGGLGLILGTIGLGFVLLRNALERTGELATLRAVGFRRSLLSRMLLVENSFLLLMGVVLGTVAALIAVSPHVFATGQVPWLSLSFTLAVVVLVGVAVSAVAARLALRAPLLPALKAE